MNTLFDLITSVAMILLLVLVVYALVIISRIEAKAYRLEQKHAAMVLDYEMHKAGSRRRYEVR